MQIPSSGIVIVGGASGLGLASAHHLAQAGARVGVIDQNRCPEWGGPSAVADVTDPAAVEAAFATLTAEVGPLRAVINTVGVGGSGLSAGPKRRLEASVFRRVLEVNTLGSFIVTQCAAEHMMRQECDVAGERGVLIMTSSIVAFEGQIGTVAYAAAKAAVIGMTLPLAREFARHGIRVVTIAPGIFETPMFSNARGPMVEWLRDQVQFPPRPGEPGEFSEMVSHIIINRMLNGTVIRLDGAYRVPPGRHDWWEE